MEKEIVTTVVTASAAIQKEVAAAIAESSGGMPKEVIAAIITSSAAIGAAVLVGIAGSLISKKFAREKDRQDKESQWRMHAIELTKLDMQRKIALKKDGDTIRPSILDFLANYRDLKELDTETPANLYKIISEKRIDKKDQP